MMVRLLLILGALSLVSGCFEPREPPPVTRMISIAGGTFLMGPGDDKLRCVKDGDLAQRCDLGSDTGNPTDWIKDLTWVPAATVKGLANFEIDEHEVTNAQYQYCVELGRCTDLDQVQVSGTDYYGEADFGDHPVVNVTRAQAAAYCAFMNKALPTEAQWERAARLGADPDYKMRTFPWPDKLDSGCKPGEARYAVTRECASMPLAVTYSEKDKTFWGVRNVASNVAEWVADDWSLYSFCEGQKGYDVTCQVMGQRCQQCKDDKAACVLSCAKDKLALCKAGTYSPVAGGGANTAGVIRGGDYNHDKCFHRLYVRRKAEGPQAYVGFRCAR